MKKTSNISWLQEKHNFSYSFALMLLKKHHIAGHLLDPEQAIIQAKAIQEEDRKVLDQQREDAEKRAESLRLEEEREAAENAANLEIFNKQGEKALYEKFFEVHIKRYGTGFSAVCDAKYEADGDMERFKEANGLK